MQILKVEVKPKTHEGTQIRLLARDDAGHVLTKSGTCKPNADVADFIMRLAKDLAVYASELTEEEEFTPK